MLNFVPNAADQNSISLTAYPSRESVQPEAKVVMQNMSQSSCASILAQSSGPPPKNDEISKHVIALILLSFPLVTVSGNTLVIVAVLTHRRLRTFTNTFVVSLALADLLVAVLVMPFAIYQELNDHQWKLGEATCLITTSLDVMFTTTSIFNLSCLAADRYFAICRPFEHQKINHRLVSLLVVACWVIPVFISFVPIMNRWNIKGIEEFYYCAAPKDSDSCYFIVNTTFAWTCSAIAFYIPAVFLIVCNIKIYLAAKRHATQIRTLELATIHNRIKGKVFRQETKAAKTLGIIMGCFCICWCPFFILNIIDPIVGYKIPYIPWSVALWLGYLNSMMNPFLYYYFNRSFKKAFLRLLKCKVCHGVSEFEDEMVTGISQASEYLDR